MDATSAEAPSEERRAPSTRRALLEIAGCASLVLALPLFFFLFAAIDDRFEDPEAPFWTAWQIAIGIIQLAIGAVLLRTAERKSPNWGLLGLWWLAILGVQLILYGTASIGKVYAWSRVDSLGIEDLGVAPGADFAEVRDRALAAGLELDPEEPSRMRYRFSAKHESSRRFLHVRFRKVDDFAFEFDDQNRLLEVSRWRISSPRQWAGFGFTTWRTVDGAWRLERRSRGTIELDAPEERR